MVTDHHSWQHALIEGVIIAPLWAVVSWFLSRRQRQSNSAVLGSMTLEQRRAVLTAANTGTPPDDPALRFAAATLVQTRLVEHDRHRTFVIAVFAVFLALSVPLAITDGLWYLVGTVALAGSLIWTLRYPRQQNRRLAALQGPAPPPPAPGQSQPR